ncbi:DUF1467 family protein [Acidimangrovimonas pyrenivorans]|uniref:DUF1467 family protein n=1 Tax=Acidimangrovimonas pyrenivorans TaxID=2030798 RepID=A0ABV7ABB3_9RHOB
MNVVEAIVVFAVTWFMVFFIVLQVRNETQGDKGEIVPGTPASAPSDFNLKRKVKITTLIALVVWAGIAWVVTSGVITIRDLDIFNRMGPPSFRTDGGTGG